MENDSQIIDDLNNLISVMQATEMALEQKALYASRAHLFSSETEKDKRFNKEEAIAVESGRKYLEIYRNGLLKVIAMSTKTEIKR